MQLTHLNCDATQIGDLSPLSGMRLASLKCGHTRVVDLSPLKGMPLTTLNCRDTQIADLSPLQGMQMTELSCDVTLISDLSPLNGMPLTALCCNATHVTDLSPLEGMNLKSLWLTPKNITKGLDVIRRMKSLNTIALGWGKPEHSPAEFWKKYDAGEFGKPDSTTATPDHKPVTDFNDPAFQQWMKEVQALTAEQQVEAVVRKLKELNPKFDSQPDIDQRRRYKIENGAVVEFRIFSDRIEQLAPLRAFPSLKLLSCAGTGHSGSVSDLSGLQGMQLERLSLWGNPLLSDLTALKGMPLAYLSISGSAVSSLSPLEGMPLTDLWIDGTRITDLSPLREMPLKILKLDFKPERDTDILRSIKTLERINDKPAAEFWKEVEEQQKGKKLGFQTPGFDQWLKTVAALPAEKQVEAVAKKLQELNPGFDGNVTGADGRGTPLIKDGLVTEFGVYTDHVADLSPVRALAGLKALACGGRHTGTGKLVDLSPLEGMSLTSLNCRQNPQVADLSPLRGMALAALDCNKTKVSDLTPLKGMKLAKLICHITRVSDLSPLKGMNLVELTCSSTQVSDLSPLQGMKLTRLICFDTQVSDLSPLEGMPLTTIGFTPKKITKGMDVIRQMKSLNIDRH